MKQNIMMMTRGGSKIPQLEMNKFGGMHNGKTWKAVEGANKLEGTAVDLSKW